MDTTAQVSQSIFFGIQWNQLILMFG
jgi:hypothetical protein